ncbi:hypothetical protein [Cohnella phaseoli]|uniref:Tail fiber-like repeat protein n=1 Tax=Cohnella phaseoli TaxID=456490 RepID=A0A3D9KGN2_9BACL|nr:hypothetical protein [Cohnella phaseoli]RED85312.1 hypothetical protein DFP98_10417 [Cohnella phaseoli]
MAEVTPNLGLKKPLESEFVSIQTLNENMDKVDQSLGPVEDLPTTAKNAAGAISEIYDQLTDKPHEQLTLTPGVQVVQGGDVPAILRSTMQGRTLVNLLGRDGNCEDLSKWSKTQTSGTSSLSTDTTNKACGNQSLVVMGSAVNSVAMMYLLSPLVLDISKNYLAVGYARSQLPATLTIGTSAGITAGGTISNSVTGNSVAWNMIYAAFKPTTTSPLYVSGNVEGNATMAPAAGFDGFRLYEITAPEKTYIDSLTTTAAQTYIAANYPYVDDMKHVNAVYLENKGKNLLPPFSEWTQYAGSSIITGSYSVTLNAGSTIQFDISCMPNQVYVFSLSNTGGKISIGTFDENMIFLAQTSNVTTGSTSKITEANAKYLRVIIDTTGLSAKNFSNPMLNIGSEALPFEPQKPSYLYLPDCNLRSNVDGSVVDRLYTDGQGKPRVMRRFREIVLDGSLVWEFVDGTSGSKRVSFASIPGSNATAIKFDGKILRAAAETYGNPDSFAASSSGAMFCLSNDDTGWGESYTPTANEIKAYFYGWRMYNDYTGLNFNQGDDPIHKKWTPVHMPWDGQGIASVVPTNFSSSYSPYRLMYQLAQSIDEPVTYEGSLMLHEGENHVEVGTGIVVREAVAPSGIALDRYHINTNVNGIPKLLKNRPDRIAEMFKNSVVDDWVKGRRNSDSVALSVYGYGYAYIQKDRFNPTAAYSVTYLALDAYTLGIAPQTISAEYAPNIRESIESLVREVVEARTETSVLKNTKAQEQQPQWIAPTLRNGWENYSNTGGVLYTNASYRKNELGYVELKGLVSQGTVGVAAFVLPTGYRPRSYRVFAVHAESGGGTMVHGEVIVFPDGQVRVYASSNVYFGFDGVVFEAEQ